MWTDTSTYKLRFDTWRLSQQTRDVGPVLVERWASVAGPPFNQHRTYISCFGVAGAPPRVWYCRDPDSARSRDRRLRDGWIRVYSQEIHTVQMQPVPGVPMWSSQIQWVLNFCTIEKFILTSLIKQFDQGVLIKQYLIAGCSQMLCAHDSRFAPTLLHLYWWTGKKHYLCFKWIYRGLEVF